MSDELSPEKAAALKQFLLDELRQAIAAAQERGLSDDAIDETLARRREYFAEDKRQRNAEEGE